MKLDEFKSVPNIGALLRGNFFSGLLVVIPLAVIVWMIVGMLRVLWGLPGFLPLEWQPERLFEDSTTAELFNFVFTLGMAFFIALVVSFLGWASKLYFGQKVLEVVADVIQRIPVIRTVYSALDQLLRTIAAGGGQQFNRVVYVEYPREGSWTIAFVTGATRVPGEAEVFLNLYVPTTPNPTSGFYLIIAEKDVREAKMSVEEAFKRILSLGIAQGQGLANK
jgi:uncharacterized membrane protein